MEMERHNPRRPQKTRGSPEMLQESPQTKPQKQNTMVHARKNTTKTRQTQRSTKML